MVRESEIRLRRNPRHVTPGARFSSDIGFVALSGIAFPAGGVIGRDLRFERGMRRVARQTREAPVGSPETVTCREHHGLMPRVPGILQIGGIALNSRHAMTLAAKGIELIGGELPGIARADFRRVLGVAGGGPMTAFAANPQFVRRDYLVRGDRKWSRRVTTEAAQDSGCGIEDPVRDAAWVFMARRAANSVELPVPGLVLFDIRFGIQAADESDGLYAGAKRPQARLRRFGRR